MNMMSMATSLEARVPLLDVRLVELASRVPPSLKYKKGISKYLLKKVAKEWLPIEIINHRKTGFGIPRVKMMKDGLKQYIEAILSKESVEKRGIFKSSYVEQVLSSFYNSQSEKMLWSEHLRVWVLFIFEIWCRIYLDGDEIGPPDCSLRDICTL
jgi:asparagine synthase (glutamine-hydrolysing)